MYKEYRILAEIGAHAWEILPFAALFYAVSWLLVAGCIFHECT